MTAVEQESGQTGPRSNPVAPTTSVLANSKVSAPAPVAAPVQELVRQAVAQALFDAANRILGKGFTPVGSLSLASTVTVNELRKEFLESRSRSGISDRYMRQLKVSLKSFGKPYGRSPITAVTGRMIEKWLYDQEWAPKTMHGYLGDVRTMFNYAVDHGYLDRNPGKAVKLPRGKGTGTIAVHTPDQVRQVLEAARQFDLSVCRLMAIRYFAGVRSAEAHRLRESDIKLDHGVIEVPAAKAKTRSRRLVTIQPNLRAWLALGGELRAVGDMTVRKVIRLSKVEWEHNVTRHSFCSYHLEHFQNAAKTALEAGHTEQMLFKNYRALVLPAVAKDFWSIVPQS